jgi:Domain of unknown function (DUF4383)
MINTVAAVFGILYLLTGLVGMIIMPGGGVLMGIFAVNTFHHIFHIVLGGLVPFSAWRNKGRLYCQITGGVLILLGVLGVIAPGLMVNLLAIPPAELFTDNLLHLVSGFALAYFGFLLRSSNQKQVQ